VVVAVAAQTLLRHLAVQAVEEILALHLLALALLELQTQVVVVEAVRAAEQVVTAALAALA
jgi:hypothetical protein